MNKNTYVFKESWPGMAWMLFGFFLGRGAIFDEITVVLMILILVAISKITKEI